MKEIIKNNSGITLAALVVTIIVMIILASIGMYEGRAIISKSKVQTLETNMLTIQAKAKGYAEKIQSKVWSLSGNKKNEKIASEFDSMGMTGPTETDGKKKYTFKNDGLAKMGLNELNASDYYVLYDSNYEEIDVVYTPGVEYNGTTYTKLSELRDILLND